jgi:hypothetical protein
MTTWIRYGFDVTSKRLSPNSKFLMGTLIRGRHVLHRSLVMVTLLNVAGEPDEALHCLVIPSDASGTTPDHRQKPES